MAPEVMCRQNHTMSVDFFAVGVMAYECMFGRVSFKAGQWRSGHWRSFWHFFIASVHREIQKRDSRPHPVKTDLD